MYTKVFVLLACAALACANDILQGSNTKGLEPFFEGRYEATWSFSRATKDVVINASGLITAINVTDLREGKDGEAKITNGGIGHPNVTITLMSPAALRGYDFNIQVYSDDEKHRGTRGEPSTPATDSKSTEKPVTPKLEVTEPVSSAKTTVTTDKAKTEKPARAEPSTPAISPAEPVSTDKTTVTTGATTEKPGSTSEQFPTVAYPTIKPKIAVQTPEEADVPMNANIYF